MTTLFPPLRGLLAHLRQRWRGRHTCHHRRWTPAGGCPCGEW